VCKSSDSGLEKHLKSAATGIPALIFIAFALPAKAQTRFQIGGFGTRAWNTRVDMKGIFLEGALKPRRCDARFPKSSRKAGI
jgi:hypothetical protein